MEPIVPTARVESVLEQLGNALNGLDFISEPGSDLMSYPPRNVKAVRDAIESLREKIRVLMCCTVRDARAETGHKRKPRMTRG